MYRWIMQKTRVLLGVLLGVLITSAVVNGVLRYSGIQLPLWLLPTFDVFLMVVISSLISLYSVYKISHKFPDTKTLLPLFSIVMWGLMLLSYWVLRYHKDFQTALSIIVAGSIAGMGWWIQYITSQASDRRKHTLNIVLSTRTCAEYQTHLRNFTHYWRGNRHAPKELCQWRDDPDNPKFKDAKVPEDLVKAINGLVYILNFFEFLAQGIKAKDLDDKLLRECFCGFLEGLERRAYFILSEAQKRDERIFEGIIYLCKNWNNEKSLVEKHRHSAPPSDIGSCYPPQIKILEILGVQKEYQHSRRRRRTPAKSDQKVVPIPNTPEINAER